MEKRENVATELDVDTKIDIFKDFRAEYKYTQKSWSGMCFFVDAPS